MVDGRRASGDIRTRVPAKRGPGSAGVGRGGGGRPNGLVVEAGLEVAGETKHVADDRRWAALDQIAVHADLPGATLQPGILVRRQDAHLASRPARRVDPRL